MLPVKKISVSPSRLMSHKATPPPLNIYSKSSTVRLSLYLNWLLKSTPVLSGDNSLNCFSEPVILQPDNIKPAETNKTSAPCILNLMYFQKTFILLKIKKISRSFGGMTRIRQYEKR